MKSIFKVLTAEAVDYAKMFYCAAKSFFHDYVDELIILIFSFPASFMPGVHEVLQEIGWNPIHFYIGVAGQLTALLMLYVRGGKAGGDTFWIRMSKGMASLVLGGMIAMVSGEYLNVKSSGALFFFGAMFQWIWDFAIDKIQKQLSERTPKNTFSAESEDGEDRPRSPRP